jgi:YfiH family protein
VSYSPAESTTPVDDRFRFEGSPAGLVLRSVRMTFLAPHLFTTRQLQFRDGTSEDDYRCIAEDFGVAGQHVLRVRQMHGALVAVARPDEPWLTVPDADAVVSIDSSRVISIRVADCVPVLLADRRARVVAAIHAGWRGTAAGVAQATVETIAELGVPPGDLVAAIGPAIGPCCYQVGEVVRQAFPRPEDEPWFSIDGPDHWRVDLAAANRAQLIRAGVMSDNISSSGLCTSHDSEHWFSFRKEGAAAGRMVAAIRLTTRSG